MCTHRDSNPEPIDEDCVGGVGFTSLDASEDSIETLRHAVFCVFATSFRLCVVHQDNVVLLRRWAS